MEPDEEPAEEPSPSLPPDPFATLQASAVQLHEGYLYLRSGGYSMVEALIYQAASGVLNVMIAAQEAVIAVRPEPPEQD
jgi:hypothetical protein